MSLSAYRWAIKQKVRNASERAVLSVLADFADESGTCFPSVGTIGELAGMCRRATIYTLKHLQERGLFTTNGRSAGRRYFLALDNAAGAKQGGAKDAPTADPTGAPHAHPRANHAPDQCKPCTQTSQEPVNEPLGADAPQRAGHEGQQEGRIKPAPTDADTKRATRLPNDWQPPPDQIARIERELPQIDWRAETEKFRDYWIAKPGQHGTKLDWPATWRNWMRNAQRFAPRGGGFSDGQRGGASRFQGSGAMPGAPSDDPWAMRLRAFRERGIWLGEWGPKPGEKGCRALTNVMVADANRSI